MPTGVPTSAYSINSLFNCHTDCLPQVRAHKAFIFKFAIATACLRSAIEFNCLDLA